MWAVDFSPQFANVADIEQSDAASANEEQAVPKNVERIAASRSFMSLLPFAPPSSSAGYRPAFADPCVAETW